MKIDLNYETYSIVYLRDSSKRQITLFVPVGLSNFGEFSPITAKEFQNDAGPEPFIYCGGYRPLDKKIISDLSEITIYMPNLLVDLVQ